MSMLIPPSDLPSAGGALEAPPDDAGALTAVQAAELGLAPAVKPRSLLRRG